MLVPDSSQIQFFRANLHHLLILAYLNDTFFPSNFILYAIIALFLKLVFCLNWCPHKQKFTVPKVPHLHFIISIFLFRSLSFRIPIEDHRAFSHISHTHLKEVACLVLQVPILLYTAISASDQIPEHFRLLSKKSQVSSRLSAFIW